MKQRIRVIGIVKKEDEILLVKKNPGRMESAPLWELPRGRLHPGEQPEEAMARVIFECVGASIEKVKLRDAVAFSMQTESGNPCCDLCIIYDIYLKQGERLVAEGAYTAYKFVSLDSPQMMASVVLEPQSSTIIDIELGRTARPIFDGVTNNMIGNNLSTATVYVDGGSRGNPGPSAIGYSIVGNDGALIKQGGNFIGFATSRVAEYYALKEGCEQAIGLGIKSVRFVSDSLMLVNQMNGIYKIKNKDVMPIYADIKELLRNFDTVAFIHVKREMNEEADRQVNLAIDRHFDLGDTGRGGQHIDA